MFIVIYKKSTKHVVSYRSDDSTGVASLLAEYFFNQYLKDNNATAEQAADLTYVETAYVELAFAPEKYLWNESTQQVEVDSSYVPSTLESTN